MLVSHWEVNGERGCIGNTYTGLALRSRLHSKLSLETAHSSAYRNCVISDADHLICTSVTFETEAPIQATKNHRHSFLPHQCWSAYLLSLASGYDSYDGLIIPLRVIQITQ
jgi:hypothetical protein